MTAVVLSLIVFAAISLKKPIWAFGIILALLPTYLIRLNILSIPTTFLELMVGVFLLSVLVTHYNLIRINPRLFFKANWGIGVFILGALIATLFSPEPIKALGQLKAFFIEPILLFYAALIIFDGEKDFIFPLRALFASATVISLFGIVQYWTHLFLPLRFWGNGEEVKRITSIFEYPNGLALYLAPVFIFFVVLFFRNYKIANRYWMSAGLLLMFVAIVLTYSRGALIGLVAGFIILALKQTRLPFKKLVVTGVVALILVSPLVFNRFKNTFNDSSSSERVELYKVAVNQVLDNPILGNGLYGFRTTLANSNYTGEILNYPHNIILNFWTETGMLGLLGFFLVIVLALKNYRSKPTTVRLAAALFLVVLIVHGMVDAPYFKNDLAILFWSMLSVFYLPE